MGLAKSNIEEKNGIRIPFFAHNSIIMKNFNKYVIPMQQIGFPIQTTFIPKEDDPVRLLFEVTEELDYTEYIKHTLHYVEIQ